MVEDWEIADKKKVKTDISASTFLISKSTMSLFISLCMNASH